jgi:hypothetical protein
MRKKGLREGGEYWIVVSDRGDLGFSPVFSCIKNLFPLSTAELHKRQLI